jgi:hypothetical protein
VSSVAAEIGTWLRAHRDQVLLLYLEDHLDGAADHDAATTAIRQSLGDLLYTPPQGAGCTKLPMSVSRDDILAAGHQVIIVSDCGEGAAWQGTAFDWSDHVENGSPGAFRDFPDCGPDHTRAVYDATLVRYIEDSTWLSAAVGGGPEPGITPEIAAAMARCGVDLLGLDQLLPGDGRLDALVWSWARDEPRAGAGDCTVQRPDGRWEARSCDERHPATCSDGTGGWLVTLRSARAREAGKLCARERMMFATPRTGYENALVRASSNGATAWLNVRAT